MEKDNCTSVLTKFVAELNLPITNQSVSDELQKHPNFNSLWAFSDLLNHWRVPNASYRIKNEKLNDVPTPFIAHIHGSRFAVVSALSKEAVIISNEKWHKKKVKQS